MSEEFVGPQDLLDSAQSFIVSLHEVSNNVTQLRLEEAETRLAAKAAEEELSFAVTEATLEISAYLGNVVDPTTKRANKDYTAMRVQQELEKHGKYKEAEQKYLDAQQAHAMKQAEMRNAMDVFTAVRGGANIVAAMLYFLSDNRSAIVVKESDNNGSA